MVRCAASRIAVPPFNGTGSRKTQLRLRKPRCSYKSGSDGTEMQWIRRIWSVIVPVISVKDHRVSLGAGAPRDIPVHRIEAVKLILDEQNRPPRIGVASTRSAERNNEDGCPVSCKGRFAITQVMSGARVVSTATLNLGVSAMIKFYYHPSPNPAKVALFLEESGLPPYRS
jgi:sRNA-binding carbon storage regulator CsrA